MKLYSVSLFLSLTLSATNGAFLDSCSKQNDCISYTIEEERPRLCTTRNCQFKVCLTLNTTKPGCVRNGPIDHTCVAGGSADPQQCNAEYVDLYLNDDQNGLGYLREAGTQCQTVTSGTLATFVFKDGNSCTEDYAGNGVAECVARTASDRSCSNTTVIGHECLWHITVPVCGETPTFSPSAIPSMLPTESASPSFLPSVMPSSTPPSPPPTPYPTPFPTPNPTPVPTFGFPPFDLIFTQKPFNFLEDKEDSDKKPDPGASGDPHVKTWTGTKFDFHGVCDLVLLQNPDFHDGLGMDIHIRTKQLYQFSYVSSAVLKIGEDTLEVSGESEGDTSCWINGYDQEILDNGIVGVVSGYPVVYKRSNTKQIEFTVKLGGERSIVMKTFKKFVSVNIHGATKESFGTSVGLMGSYGSGERLSRDGNTILEDINEFGQNWQVIPSDGMLFHNVEGPQSPEKCEIPVSSSIRRRLAESKISEKEAEVACARVDPSDFEMCVFDVMATGDKDVVGAY